jgi:F-type H+-transporting ATPase subunit a
MLPAFALVAAESPLDHVLQHPLVTRPAHFGFLTPEGHVTVLSDQILMMIVAGLLLILVMPAWARRRRGTDDVGRHVPAGGGNFLEAICEYLRKEVAEPALHEHTDRFIKYIWTTFFFILTINLLGLLPLPSVSRLALGTHIGGTATGNIWVTGTLAVMTMFMMVINGLRLGGKDYLAHFSPGPLWLAPLLIPVEIIGLIARVFALAVRLFSNMIAGHILLAVLLSLILSAGTALGVVGGVGIGIPVVLASAGISLLEVFVAFLQAFIFTFLTALFLGASVLVHHSSDHSDEEAHAAHRGAEAH